MTLPAPGYLSNAERTNSEMKQALEDQRGFVARVVGAVTVLTEKAEPDPSQLSFPVDGDGADDTATIQAAIAAANGGRIYGRKGPYNAPSLSDPLGADFDDGVRVLKGGKLYNTYAHRQMVWGGEHLYGHYNRVRSRSAIKVVFSGDSTTLGDGLGAGDKIDQVVLAAAKADGLTGITVVNHGRPTFHTGDWDATYAAMDIAANPNVLVVRWGLNDPGAGRTMEQFAASLRSGLAKVRAAFPLSSGVAIVLMTPNAADTPNVDALWIESAQRVVRRAARDFHCAFIDAYGLFQDAEDSQNLWMDAYKLHPTAPYNWALGSAIYDMLFPSALLAVYRSSGPATISTANSWVAAASPMAGPKARRKGQRVFLQGAVKNGTAGWGTVIGTIPAGYRPTEAQMQAFTVAVQTGDLTWATGMVSVDAAGQIMALAMPGNTSVHLDGISFVSS